MTDYRCYCLAGDRHIHKATMIASDSDEGARARAAELLDACYHHAVEIWDGARYVGQVTSGDRPADVPTEPATRTCCGGCAG
jgi:hypothetical protein